MLCTFKTTTPVVLLLIVACLSFWSCKDDAYSVNSTLTNSVNLQGKLKAITQTFENASPKSITNFQYDNKGVLLSYQVVNGSTTLAVSFKRDSLGHILKETSISNTNGQTSQTERNYSYNSAQLINKVTENIPNSQDTYVETFSYNNTGLLINYTKVLQKTTQKQTLISLDYSWKNGNVITQAGNFSIGNYDEIDFQYDDKPNLYQKVLKLDLPIARIDPEEISQNNAAVFQKLFDGSRVKYEYTYNSNNLPNQKNSFVFSNSQWVKQSTTQYEYY